MAGVSLKELANRSVALDFDIGGQVRHARGIGFYEWVEGVGFALRIHVEDAAGDFDVILGENRFSGTAVPDTESGCDFHICLHAGDLCLHAT